MTRSALFSMAILVALIGGCQSTQHGSAGDSGVQVHAAPAECAACEAADGKCEKCAEKAAAKANGECAACEAAEGKCEKCAEKAEANGECEACEAADGKCEKCAAKEASAQGMLRHVVHFRFNEDATDEQIAEVEQAFAALPDEISSIRDFEWGHTDISVEELNNDYTHCFIVTFDDVEGLEEYLPHPAHEEFVELIGPVLDEAFVADYIVE